MKKLYLILGIMLVVCTLIQNRAVLLLPFVHSGMTHAQVAELLGHEGEGNGFVVKGLLGSGPARETWTYYIHLFGYSFGTFPVHFEGDDQLKTKKEA
jgi:hypothetical protein